MSITGRASYLVFMLSAVILLTAIVIPVESGLKLANEVKAGDNVFKFKWICD